MNGVLSGIANRLNVPNEGQNWRPKIFCANMNVPKLAQYWQVCRNRSVYATASTRYQYVFLCQKLFSLKALPEATDCAGTLEHGLEPTGQSLARKQMTILLHELVDIYLPTMPGIRPLRPQVFGLNAVIDLPASQSVINPANYVFYVASTSLPCYVTLVTPRTDLGRYHGLLHNIRTCGISQITTTSPLSNKKH